MSRREKTPKRWITADKLDKEIKNRKIEVKMLRRLIFIRELYRGESVPDACKKVGVWKGTGYNWLRDWNRKCIDGLKPQFDGGPKPRLSSDQTDDLKEQLKKRDDWTTKEIQNFIMVRFNVSYTNRHIGRLLKSFDMNH